MGGSLWRHLLRLLSAGKRREPLVGFLLRLVTEVPVTFLQLADQPVALAGDHFDVIVGELPELLPCSAL